MNADELLLVQETKSSVNRGAHRGVSKATILADDEMVGDSFQFQKPAPTKHANATPFPKMPLKELSLMHVKLQAGKFADMWSSVSGVVNSLNDTDPIVDSKHNRVIGNFYQAGNFCEFLVGLYEVQRGPVVDFKRLCGDGFTMDTFYRKVKDGLISRKVVVDDAVEEEVEDNDIFDCYSSDEEDQAAAVTEEEDKYLHPNGFLQLSYDENLVTMWIEKIRMRHIEDKNHMMGLMAHNAMHPDNLNIIVQKGGDSLVKLCMNILESENNSAAVPLVRNTSSLVMQLAAHTDMWTVDAVDAMLEAMMFWVPGKNGRKEKAKTGAFEVTESRETVNYLIETLYLMSSKVDVNEMQKCFATPSEKRTATLRSYLESREESKAVTFVLSLFPQS